jgi:hypothetical protein
MSDGEFNEVPLDEPDLRLLFAVGENVTQTMCLTWRYPIGTRIIMQADVTLSWGIKHGEIVCRSIVTEERQRPHVCCISDEEAWELVKKTLQHLRLVERWSPELLKRFVEGPHVFNKYIPLLCHVCKEPIADHEAQCMPFSFDDDEEEESEVSEHIQASEYV